MFGSEQKEARRQFDSQMASAMEANDGNIAMAMKDIPNVGYDSQVSAMLISVDQKFLPLKFIPMLDEKGKLLIDENGNPKGRWVQGADAGYNEPYGNEAMGFICEADGERKLINQMDGTLNAIFSFAQKHNRNMSLSFNYFSQMRKGQLIGTMATGKLSRLAKSQFVESKADINRFVNQPKKKGFLSGLFG